MTTTSLVIASARKFPVFFEMVNATLMHQFHTLIGIFCISSRIIILPVDSDFPFFKQAQIDYGYVFIGSLIKAAPKA